MHAGDERQPGARSALHEELGGLRARLTQRETSIAELEAIVQRQVDLLERYDAVVRDMSPGHGTGQVGSDSALANAIDRCLVLLEQAISGAEARARQVSALEAQLDRALGLLDASLRNQEAVMTRPEARLAAPVDYAAHDAIEETLAKYDGMLERSLAALETAYLNGQSTKKEVDERDRLLTRTLDLLQTTVDAEANGARKPGLIGRLFS